ncbi:hypothetical protein [Luteococcus sp. OSA5]|uniref:hypothetical protein n=1 Tax=Luteococcus sp. OSA5 TaxID=3401630 RepID=UPI003B42FD1B
MSNTSTVSAAARRNYPLGWVIALLASILLMGVTAFFHLIKHDLLPLYLLASPVVVGLIGGAALLMGERFPWRQSKLWAAILIVGGIFSVAMMLFLMVYVLPLEH